MKYLIVILPVIFLAACSGQDGTKSGSGDSNVSNNTVGGDLIVIDNDVRTPGEGSSASIDQLNDNSPVAPEEDDCELSPETCAEMEE